MKKAIFTITATLLLILCACQNDGNIGDLFGTWRVDTYTLDGTPQNVEQVKNTTFSFQNNIVEIQMVTDDYGSTYERFGTWSKNGNTLTLDFTHHDDNTPEGTGIYQAPEWLGLPSATTTMTITDNTSREMTLQWTDATTGATHIYNLHKTW